MLAFERALWRRGVRDVCGVDEVGLGPLAGPVIAAAVVLPRQMPVPLYFLNDSKKVSPARRVRLAVLIQRVACGWAIGGASEREIERFNIFYAARLAARRAVTRLIAEFSRPIAHILLDAHPLHGIQIAQTCIVKGDEKSQSVAAASILAKVARDAHMRRLDAIYPQYGFAAHAGYATRAHIAALDIHGASRVHRRNFSPVKRLLREVAHA